MSTRLTAGLSRSAGAHKRWLRLAVILCAVLPLLAAPGMALATTSTPLQQAGDGSTPVNVADSSLGQILVDANGMTLYMFDNDDPGTSNCYDGCARRWPPLLVDAGAQPTAGAGVSATLGVTERTDGTFQVTANDWPLYYWFEDTQPGDVLGQAVGDVWWVLGPDGSIIRAAAAEAEAPAEATMEATAEAMAEATVETSAAPDTSDTTDTGAMSGAPQQLPTTGAAAGTLGALIAALGIAAGGGWVALRNRKH